MDDNNEIEYKCFKEVAEIMLQDGISRVNFYLEEDENGKPFVKCTTELTFQYNFKENENKS